MSDTDESVSLVRTIKAPAAKVFTAWTDGTQLQRWLAPIAQAAPMIPTGKEPTTVTVELRPSGRNTEVSVRHEGLKNPTYREAIRQGAWAEALTQLDSLLAAA